jgi:hypothetical protein
MRPKNVAFFNRIPHWGPKEQKGDGGVRLRDLVGLCYADGGQMEQPSWSAEMGF